MGEITRQTAKASRRLVIQSIGIGLFTSGILVVSARMGWPWYLTAIALVALLVFLLATLYEQAAVSPKQIALVATLSAVASVSRAAVQAIPNAQPATFLVLVTGFSLGPMTGATVGVFTALGSNIFLGEGGWTPWQMLGWGLVGWSAGMLRKSFGARMIRPQTIWFVLAPMGFVWGFLFDWLMDTWTLLTGAAAGIPAFLAIVLSGLPFDINHAVATLLLTIIAGPVVFRMLERYRLRLQITRVLTGTDEVEGSELLDDSSSTPKITDDI